MKRVTALALLASAFSLLMAPLASAQTDYPNRAITMVVPFAAGGATDVIARIVAEGMSRQLGKPIIIENVAGAGGTIGSIRVMRGRARRLHAADRAHGNPCVVLRAV